MSTSDPSAPAPLKALKPVQSNGDSNTKRNLFGRKKKSSTNLSVTSSSNTLASSQKNNDSTESLGSAGSAEANGQRSKGIKNVFKRKPRNELAASSVGIMEEDQTSEGGGSEVSKATSVDSDEGGSESDLELTTRQPIDDSPSGPIGTLSKNRSGTLSSRRSTSPMAPPHRASTTANITEQSQAKENPKGFTNPRPSTSEGEVRSSTDRRRRVGRISVGTSDASDVPPVPSIMLGVGDDRDSAEDRSTPSTTITPPTPTDGTSHLLLKGPVGTVVNGPGERRSRTGSLSTTPSKLSQSMTITPTDNDPALQSGINNGTGFFQSMISAAQNAATSLTSNIPLNLPNNQGNRSKSGIVNTPEIVSTEGVLEGSGLSSGPEEPQEPEREPAIKTLGQGELNLETLGIIPEPEPKQPDQRNAALTSNNRNNGVDNLSKDDPIDGGQRPLLAARMTATGLEAIGDSSRNKPRSPRRAPYAEGGAGGNVTPDRTSMIGAEDHDEMGEGPRNRSGSVRSSGTASAGRQRGSSGASTGNLLQPVPKPTGFAVASKRRNRDFHNLFRSVPEDDYLIEDYGCALQKEILLQGRLYVSEGHICFYSNILGWVTTLVISFDEVMSVEKKSTALLFPNAIVIQTLHARHTFASFISRDSTYDLILGLWNVGHPQIVASSGEAHLRGPDDGDEEETGDDDDEEYEDETEEDLGESFMDAGDGSFEDEDKLAAVSSGSKGPSRKPSQLPLGGGATGGDGGSAFGEFPGPKTHAPTVCGDDGQHYDKPLCDETFAAPLGKIYTLLFGPQSLPFINRLLAEEERVLDIQMPNSSEYYEIDGKKTRNFSYIKPLAGSIGPKQTKCLITETMDYYDLEDHVSVTVSTQTPDVPSGNVFSVKTRYCLQWGENNGTRVVCNCTVEWTGKSWIKGPIEKGANEGQIAYNKTLIRCLRKEIAPKRLGVTGRTGGKGKGKRRKDGDAKGPAAIGAIGKTAVVATAQRSDWGLLAPLEPILEPIFDIIKPLLPANFGFMLLAVVLTFLVASKLALRTSQNQVSRAGNLGSPGHWEDIWRREEQGLWDWLEDRIGMDEIPTLQQRNSKQKTFEKVFESRTAGTALKDRQVDEAIVAMEERLDALRKVVEKRKQQAANPAKEL